MCFEFGYLGEIDFIFETNLGFESGDQMGSCDEKKDLKNLMQVYH